jgi:hypothetical protein
MNIVLPAEVTPYDFGGWSLPFWVGEAFDEEANSVLCRSAVDQLAVLLGRHAPVDLKLPPPQPLEIVVEAPLCWRAVTYHLIFNTFDGVVALEHREREPLDRVLCAVEDALNVVQVTSR